MYPVALEVPLRQVALPFLGKVLSLPFFCLFCHDKIQKRYLFGLLMSTEVQQTKMDN